MIFKILSGNFPTNKSELYHFSFMDMLTYKDRLTKLALGSGKPIISANVGDLEVSVPPSLKKAYFKVVSNLESNTYTPPGGLHSLRETFKRKHTATLGTQITPKRVIVSSGSEACGLGIKFFLDKHRQAGLPTSVALDRTSYWKHRDVIQAEKGKVVNFEMLTWSTVIDEPKLNLDGFKQMIAEGHRLFVFNFGNPLGYRVKPGEAQDLAKLFEDHNAQNPKSPISYIIDSPYNGYYPNNGFWLESELTRSGLPGICIFPETKNLGTGTRIGSLIAPESIVSELVKFKGSYSGCPSRIDQMAVDEFLRSPDSTKETDEIHAQLRSRKDWFYRHLKTHCPAMEAQNTQRSEGPFYAYLNVGEDAIKFCEALAISHGIVATPGHFFDKDSSNPCEFNRTRIRFSFGTVKEHNIEEIAKAVGEVKKVFLQMKARLSTSKL